MGVADLNIFLLCKCGSRPPNSTAVIIQIGVVSAILNHSYHMGVGKLILFFFFLLWVSMGVVIQKTLPKILKMDVVMSNCLGVNFLGSWKTKTFIISFFFGS